MSRRWLTAGCEPRSTVLVKSESDLLGHPARLPDRTEANGAQSGSGADAEDAEG